MPALALPTILLTGCPGIDPPAGGPPCEDDLTMCEDGTSKFVEDPSCELSGDLELQLGEGQDDFSPLAADQPPQTYSGFQGGQHLWLGVRVVNADLERPLLEVRVSMKYCEENCDDPSNWRTDNVRELVADSNTLTTTSDGWYELSSVLVQVFNWSFAANQRIEMLVTDPCSRQGYLVHETSQ
ncbi:hypothetical protein DB30_07612 [Enhygromyxa salina]|uniref:Uncharacterized protein n=1 Tax=Enhygromyxa salina TaxID=215803 RepID=A0A0C2CRH1_9BACT|nr:hypothetical protein DB30_07612 [Enhygromyxa salina]